jgi:hypothetical protein
MANHVTANLLESNLSDLDNAISDLRDHQFFDTAEVLETTILLLRTLQRAEILPYEAVEEEGPISGDLNTLRELCAEMKVLQLKALDIKAQAAEVKIPLDHLRLKKIPDMMQALDVKTATFQGIGRVQTASDLYCSTAKGRKAEAMTWLRDCGYEEMISESYNASSMKALMRRLIMDGTDTPEFMNITPFVRASIVKV